MGCNHRSIKSCLLVIQARSVQYSPREQAVGSRLGDVRVPRMFNISISMSRASPIPAIDTKQSRRRSENTTVRGIYDPDPPVKDASLVVFFFSLLLLYLDRVSNCPPVKTNSCLRFHCVQEVKELLVPYSYVYPRESGSPHLMNTRHHLF